MLYYRKDIPKDAEKYWAEEGRRLYRERGDTFKVNGDQKAAAAKVLAAAAAPADKVAALIAYTRSSVRDVFDPGVTTADRTEFFKHMPKDRQRTAAEILSSGMGTGAELAVVFVGLANQEGMESRLAYIANRAEVSFTPKALTMTDPYFLDQLAIGVRMGNDWRIFDVADRTLAPGMLASQEEGVFALIADPKTPSFVRTDPAPPEASTESRTAKLQLTTNGSLEGDVAESLTGHAG